MVAKYLKLKKKRKLSSPRHMERKQKRTEKLNTRKSAIEMAVICNEFTNEPFPHSHSHMYLKTKHPKTFKSVKKFCKKALHTTVNDIQRPLNFRETVRYITKTDPKAIVYNVHTKFCGTVWRAHQYAQTHNTVIWSDDLPSGIAACDRKVFESHVKMEKMADENAIVVNRSDHELLYWQKRLLTLI